MKRSIDWMKISRGVLTTFLVSFAVLVNISLSYGDLARSPGIFLTVDTSSYRVTDTDIRPENTAEKDRYTGENRNKDLIENSRDQLKNAADDLREKVSLDKPLPETARNLGDAAKDKIERIIQPE